MPNTRAPRAQNGIGKDWTIVKLNSMKIPIGLDIDEFAKQVRSARGGERELSRVSIIPHVSSVVASQIGGVKAKGEDFTMSFQPPN